MIFRRDRLKEGYILHCTKMRDGQPDTRLFGGFPASTIQRILKDGYHDAMIVRKRGELMVGEMRPPIARCTPLEVYEDAMTDGTLRVDVLRPFDYDPTSGMWASHWFVTYADGKHIYNFAAYPLLLWKALHEEFTWPQDIRWSQWCSEEDMWAWLVGPTMGTVPMPKLDQWGMPLDGELPPPGERLHDYWRKDGDTTDLLRPTPLTTEHRWSEGKFVCVTGECVEPGETTEALWLWTPA